MKYAGLFTLTLLISLTSCKKYRFFTMAGDDFVNMDLISSYSNDKIQPFFQTNGTISYYQYSFCENKKLVNGIVVKSYEQCQGNIKDSTKIQRVISLLFLDKHRVLYISSNYNWDNIDSTSKIISLDDKYARVKESTKCKGRPICVASENEKKKIRPYTCYRGYYEVNDESLIVMLDEGKTVNSFIKRKMSKKLKSSNQIPKDEKESTLYMQLFFRIINENLILDSLRYRDEDYGVDDDTPLTKKISAIYESPIEFKLTKNLDANFVSLRYNGKIINNISYDYQNDLRNYHFRDGSIKKEIYPGFQNIETW